MQPLAEPAIGVAHDGSLRFVPERFKGVYLNWLENIHDWCISRQLWWGHRIPVWYCHACHSEFVTDEETMTTCPACGGAVEQDHDVLDTWFSSGLWPFSTLGWPEHTPDLARYYPSSVMETGYEILFFWVARMVFFGIEMMGEAPFHTVYLHGTVRDAEGAKMSKTKGNVLDPTEITAEYGADALRFALVTQGSPGLDMRLSMQLVESSRNFVNKLWNAVRFSLGAIDGIELAFDDEGPERPAGTLSLADRWILSRTDAITAEVTTLFESHLYGEAGRQMREFVWSELCDWYIEAAKVRLRGSSDEKSAVAQTLAFVIERSLRLLHPFMPFATEVLWQHVPHRGESVMVAPWPVAGARDEEAEAVLTQLQELVTRIRNSRAEMNVEPAKLIAASIHTAERVEAFESLRAEISMLARISGDELTIRADPPNPRQSDVVVVAGEVAAVLPLEGLIDFDAERTRLVKELESSTTERERLERQLANQAFVERAPAQVVDGQRERLRVVLEQIAVLDARIAQLHDR
jgi:valyl-tRNA synthetase